MLYLHKFPSITSFGHDYVSQPQSKCQNGSSSNQNISNELCYTNLGRFRCGISLVNDPMSFCFCMLDSTPMILIHIPTKFDGNDHISEWSEYRGIKGFIWRLRVILMVILFFKQNIQICSTWKHQILPSDPDTFKHYSPPPPHIYLDLSNFCMKNHLLQATMYQNFSNLQSPGKAKIRYSY